MKKAVSCLIALILILNTALGYTSTTGVNGIKVTVNDSAGKTVTVRPKTSDITGWNVVTGSVVVENNQYITTAENVEIEGIINPNGEYKLVVQLPSRTTVEKKVGGTSVTVVAPDTDSGDQVFKKWSSTEIALTVEQQKSKSITFTMPQNDVTLVAEYGEDVTISPYTITTIEHHGATIEGVYTNHKCSICGGKDHECEEINIIIKAKHAQVVEPTGEETEESEEPEEIEEPEETEEPETTTSPYTITTVEHKGGNVEGVYTNHVCSVCGGKDHECETVVITIKADNVSVEEN